MLENYRGDRCTFEETEGHDDEACVGKLQRTANDQVVSVFSEGGHVDVVCKGANPELVGSFATICCLYVYNRNCPLTRRREVAVAAAVVNLILSCCAPAVDIILNNSNNMYLTNNNVIIIHRVFTRYRREIAVGKRRFDNHSKTKVGSCG